MEPHDWRGTADRVIVLDLDDTLYLERDYVESGLNAVGRWAERQLGLHALGEVMICLFRQGMRGHLFDQGLERAGIAASPDLIARMLRVYRLHTPRIALAEDAERLLARRPPRTAYAIITDGFLDAQKRKLRALRLHRCGIALAVCTDQWGRSGWKPSPKAFEHVQSVFGASPDRFVYVADNPNKDFHAPRQLGWQTVQISRPERLHHDSGPGAQPADRQIATLDDLLH